MLKRGLGLLGLAGLLVLTMPAVRIQASEPGIITALSEKLYLEKNTDSTVLANVLQGSSVELIFMETDEAGNTWYYIRTDTGLEGYLPAESAQAVNTQQNTVDTAESEQQPVEDKKEEKEDIEDNPSEQKENVIHVLENVNIRKELSTQSTILGNIPKNTDLSYIRALQNESGEIWYQISYQGIDGYVRSDAVKADTEPQIQNPEEEQIDDPQEMTQEQTETENEVPTQEPEETKSADIQPDEKQEKTRDEAVTQQTQSNEEDTAETAQKVKKKHFPELFEIGLFAGMAVCVAVLILLIRKIKKILK